MQFRWLIDNDLSSLEPEHFGQDALKILFHNVACVSFWLKPSLYVKKESKARDERLLK
jgi:hypothetical protein